MDEKRWDVIVVGSGPGGCMAAKKCAQGGLKTLLVEKRKLPRDKVCTGMIMGPWAKGTIREEFGQLPKEVLVAPHCLSGVMLHVSEVEPQVIKNNMPLAWRKDLDYWMCQKAVQAGVQVRDRVRVINAISDETGYEVEFHSGQTRDKFYTRFVIGGDGVGSAIRRSLFPALQSRYRPVYRECYAGQLAIEKDYFHWFFPMIAIRPRFDVHHKEKFFLIEGGGVKELRSEINRILKDYGFDPDTKPVWRDACLMSAALNDDLLKGAFNPAIGNALLVGDAGGFALPFTGEGIGTAFKSGGLAAEAILEAINSGGKADIIYTNKLRRIMEVLQRLQSLARATEETATKGANALAESMAKLIEETFSACNL